MALNGSSLFHVDPQGATVVAFGSLAPYNKQALIHETCSH